MFKQYAFSFIVALSLHSLNATQLTQDQIMTLNNIQKAPKGWSLLASFSDINLSEISAPYSWIWTYRNGQWYAFSSKSNDLIVQRSDISLLKILRKGEGFWLLKRGQSLPKNEFLVYSVKGVDAPEFSFRKTLYFNDIYVTDQNYIYGGGILPSLDAPSLNGYIALTDKLGYPKWGKMVEDGTLIAQYCAQPYNVVETIHTVIQTNSNQYIGMNMGMCGHNMPLFISFDENGDTLWKKRLYTSWSDGWTQQHDIKINTLHSLKEGFLAVGVSGLPLHYKDNDGIERVLEWGYPSLLKINNDGTIAFAKSYSYKYHSIVPGYSGLHCFDPTIEGGLCSNEESEGIDFEIVDVTVAEDGIYLFGNVTSTKGKGFIILKVDKDGNLLFAKEFLNSDPQWHNVALEGVEGINGIHYLSVVKSRNDSDEVREYLYKLSSDGEVLDERLLGTNTYYTYFRGFKSKNSLLYLESGVVGGVCRIDPSLQPSNYSIKLNTAWINAYAVDDESIIITGNNGPAPNHIYFAKLPTLLLDENNGSSDGHFTLNSLQFNEVDMNDTASKILPLDHFIVEDFKSFIREDDNITISPAPELNVTTW